MFGVFTYVEFGVLACALLQGAFGVVASGLRSRIFGTSSDTRGAERASGTKSSATND